jgi:aminoglycoside phosphotransferase (APT) family kinase protein
VTRAVADALAACYGDRAIRIGGGHHSDVFRVGDRVVKAYLPGAPAGLHRIESGNLARAGLGDWVLEVVDAGLSPCGRDLLVMRWFDGKPLTAASLTTAAVLDLGAFLDRLHARRFGALDLAAVSDRLDRFAGLDGQWDVAPIVSALRGPLEEGALAGSAAFCHLDLWRDNILVDANERVHVVDWVRAGLDDPARDLAIFRTGTLDELDPERAEERLELLLAGRDQAFRRRVRWYTVLTYLHDLEWFSRRKPEGAAGAWRVKGERARRLLEEGL